MSNIKTCPNCNGVGQQIRDNGEPGLCHKCYGDGVVQHTARNKKDTEEVNEP